MKYYTGNCGGNPIIIGKVIASQNRIFHITDQTSLVHIYYQRCTS